MKKAFWLAACILAACGTQEPAETWQGTFGSAAATLALSELDNNEVQGELSIASSNWPVTGTSDAKLTLFILPIVDEEILFATLEAATAPGYQPTHAVDIVRMDLQETDGNLQGTVIAPFSGLKGQAQFTR